MATSVVDVPGVQEFLTARLTPVQCFSEMPEGVRRGLLNLWSRHEGGRFQSYIGDPDDDFNATDTVRSVLPCRRFICGGVAENIVFLLYEHGGIGFHVDLVLYPRGECEPVAISLDDGWSGLEGNGTMPRDIDTIRKWVLSGSVYDVYDFEPD